MDIFLFLRRTAAKKLCSCFCFGNKFISDVNPEKVILKIIDTGKGMSNEMVAFYNALLAQQTEKPKMTRIGMGFQMISELLTLMDATMEIKSHLGLGTEIQIRFENHKS